MSFSAIGRSALAFASVVVMPSAAINDAARLSIISFWCCELPPKLRARRGVAGMVVSPLLLRSAAQRQAALVELLLDLVEALLAEVGDVQQIVLGLGQQFANRVDLGALQAVAGALREVQILDRQIEVGGRRGDGSDFSELEALRLVAEIGHQSDQRAQRRTGRRKRLSRRDRPVRLDVEDQTLVVGALLDAGRLDLEHDSADGRASHIQPANAHSAVLPITVTVE